MPAMIEMATDLDELANFLSEANNQKSSHIGYCGDKVKEIHATLKEDFVQENGRIDFFIARNMDGKIDVAIGLDIDEESAEVWDPLIKLFPTDYNKNYGNGYCKSIQQSKHSTFF